MANRIARLAATVVTMRGKYILTAILLALVLSSTLSCQPSPTLSSPQSKSIVVTYSILGSIVKELVGDKATVTVSIPNGLDPHEWQPSAKDIEAINKADLVIENGLGLEGGLEKTLQAAKDSGVKFFTASDYITVRHVGTGEGIPSGDPDQVVGAADPHLWMDPIAMKSVVSGLATVLRQDLNLDVSSQAADLENRLDSLNTEIANTVAAIPQEDRKLVTGHESMGYFAQRYGFKLVGVIIPSLSTEAEVSATNLAELKQAIEDNQVKAIFTELGTSSAAAKAISDETGVKVVELTTHALPSDGSYFTFMRNTASVITNALKGPAPTIAPASPSEGGGIINWLITPFSSNSFMLHALIAGILVSIACAIAGTFVILRGLAFIGDALAHGVLPGIAVAILAGFPGILGAAIGAAAMIGGITWITQRSRLSSDTAIGLLFVGMLSLGVVIVSRSNSFTGNLTSILFGEILGIGMTSIWIQLAATIVIAGMAAICARPFLLLSFDPEQAQVAGFSSRLYHNIMLFMIAITVIVSFQTVGTLLVFGMLIAPAGAGALLARRTEAMIAWAILFGVLSMYLGLLISYHFNLAAGASIVMVTVVIFFVVFIIQNLRSRRAVHQQEEAHG